MAAHLSRRGFLDRMASARPRLITIPAGRLLLVLVGLLLAVPQAGLRAEPQAVGSPGLWQGLLDPTFGPMFGRQPGGIVLQRVSNPDSERTRWLRNDRSVERTANLGEGDRLVQLDHFGRKADAELSAALVWARRVVLDLRANRGGSVSRMLRIAARFSGPVDGAVRLVGGSDDVRLMAIPAPEGAIWHGPITVLVGADTMSSGEVLAALLRRYAGASVLGERTFGKDYALRVEPVAQGWRALIPDGRIEVPDEVLAGGLLPDGPIPPELAARIATN